MQYVFARHFVLDELLILIFIINVSFLWTKDYHEWSFQDLDNDIKPSWTMIYDDNMVYGKRRPIYGS